MGKTHWKKLRNPKYLGAYDFQPGEERVVTFKEFKSEKVVGHGGEEENCVVAYFKENCKPMILNTINCKTLTDLFESAAVEDWVNKQVTLIIKKEKHFGEIMDVIRVKKKLPTDNKTQTIIERAKKHIENSKNLEDLAKVKNYLLTDELKKMYTKKMEELTNV